MSEKIIVLSRENGRNKVEKIDYDTLYKIASHPVGFGMVKRTIEMWTAEFKEHLNVVKLSEINRTYSDHDLLKKIKENQRLKNFLIAMIQDDDYAEEILSEYELYMEVLEANQNG